MPMQKPFKGKGTHLEGAFNFYAPYYYQILFIVIRSLEIMRTTQRVRTVGIMCANCGWLVDKG